MSKKVRTTKVQPRTTGGAVAPARQAVVQPRTRSYSPRRQEGMKSGTRRTKAASVALYSPYVEVTTHRRNAKK